MKEEDFILVSGPNSRTMVSIRELKAQAYKQVEDAFDEYCDSGVDLDHAYIYQSILSKVVDELLKKL